MPYDDRFEDFEEHDCDCNHHNHDFDDHFDGDHDHDHDNDGNFFSPFSHRYGVSHRARYGAGLDIDTFFENYVTKGRKKSTSGWTGFFKALASSYLVKYSLIVLGLLFGYQLILAAIGLIISLFS